MCPLSLSHMILCFERSGILKQSVYYLQKQSSSLGLTPVPPVAHDDPDIVQGSGTSTRFRG